MHEQYTNLTSTSNGHTLKAIVVSKSPTTLVVFIKQSDTKLTLVHNGRVYVGNKVGIEFTSTGEYVR